MKLERLGMIELSSAVIALISGLLLLFWNPVFSYSLILFSSVLSVFWLINSFNKRYFGRIPWFAIIFAIPLAVIPFGMAMKLSILSGGAFLLFIGLVLGVIAIAAIFFLVLSTKEYLEYLKNVAIRLVTASALGIIIYFTPQMEIIEMVYSGNPDRAEFYKNKMLYPYKTKPRKLSIAFVSNRSGNSDILEIFPDGTGLKPLIGGPGNQWSPRPDKAGHFMYYLDDKDSIIGLYKRDLRLDSTEFIKKVEFDDFYFNLHPVNNEIIAHDTSDGFYQLFIHDLESGNVNQLTDDSCNCKKPAFFNSGTKIIFQSDCGGNDDIYLMDLEKDSIYNLTSSESNERNPSLSPYDDVFVFHSDRDSLRRVNLYYMILESGETGQLTNSPGMELMANFSPNAKDLVFGSNRDDNWEIYLMSNEGEFKDRLTNHPAFDGDAVYIERSYLRK